MAIRQKEPGARSSTRSAHSVCNSKVRCEIDAGGHTIITDEPVPRGGDDTGASPLACLTASLAACQTVQIVKVAEAMQFNHGAISIEATTTTDRTEGKKGNDKVMRFSGASLVIDIETDEPSERVDRLASLSEDRCPVGNLFSDAGFEPSVTWNARPMKG